MGGGLLPKRWSPAEVMCPYGQRKPEAADIVKQSCSYLQALFPQFSVDERTNNSACFTDRPIQLPPRQVWSEEQNVSREAVSVRLWEGISVLQSKRVGKGFESRIYNS